MRPLCTAAVLVFFSVSAQAESRSRQRPPADLARLQEQVQRQRQVLIMLIKADQRRNEQLLKLLDESLPAPVAAPTPTPTPVDKEPEPPRPKPSPPPAARAAESTRTATLSGTVKLNGRPSDQIYVYVDNVKGALARGKTFEIKQKDKQFVPQVAVVQKGTRLVFPNFDALFHNVFSLSPGNSFDLGAYNASDAARSVMVTQPGVVEIFCNMHSRMTASVLVTPSALFAKVGADGKFTLENVPVGERRVIAWEPQSTPQTQQVVLTETGATLAFLLEPSDRAAHTNKFGQPYGSYGD